MRQDRGFVSNTPSLVYHVREHLYLPQFVLFVFPDYADFYTAEVETKGARSWWLRLWCLIASPTFA